ACAGELVLFTDGDLAYSLDHLDQLVKALDRNDVAIGSRNLVQGATGHLSLRRRVLGWGFNRLARVIMDMPYSDTQAGLKGFRRDAAERIFAQSKVTDFTFDVELLYLAHRLGLSVGEVPARVSESHSAKIS